MLRTNQRCASRQGGFALLMVLFVLLALLVLAAPFLMTARTAERAGAQASDRARVRITLDAASRHTRAVLEESHAGLDSTPWADSLEELDVSPQFPEGFLNAADSRGAMWDVESLDLAGRLDLSSASPYVIANLLDLSTLVARPVAGEDEEVRTTGLAGLPEEGGFVWIGGELMRYGSSERGALTDLARGQRTSMDDEDRLITTGPHPSRAHDLGQPILDARAWSLVLRRISERNFLLPMDSFEQLEELQLFTEGPTLDEHHMSLLREATTPHGGLRGGSVWQRPARIVNSLEPDVRGLQVVVLDNRRWFTEGTTVMITDGVQTEMRVVIDQEGNGLLFDRKLQGTYLEYTALAYPLSRRPVNVNTASPLVLKALFTNLGLRGRNQRIDAREAEALVALVVESRPFDHFQDFLERIVLPAAGIATLPESAPVEPEALVEGEAIIDTHDAEALYRNALNANDYRLQFSTMPFCFTSRDVYEHELRATVNAESGVERASAVRERVELVAPQGELFSLWARQEDFDEMTRLPRGGAYWMTGPEVTTRWDQGTIPPSRFSPHWGSLGNGAFNAESYLELASEIEAGEADVELPVPERIFADREEDGFSQLWPSRTPSITDGMRVEHFDYETRSLEGRYLPDETIRGETADYGWEGDGGLLNPFHFSLWMRERDRSTDGLLLDVSGEITEADRVTLSIEDEDLVLRVLDGFGDHNATDLIEATEARYALDEGDGPGLPVDVWHHVSVDVEGSRPDQINLMVNGTSRGVRYLGMSKLAAGLGSSASLIQLEDGDGFPERGVVRIGNEVIEYRKTGEDTLDASWSDTEAFGGRMARERFDDSGPPPDGGVPIHASSASAYPTTALSTYSAGTPVSVYGYSLPLLSDMLPGGGETDADLGVFRVARVIGVEGAQTPEGDPIQTSDLVPFQGFVYGYGITDQEQLGLVLTSADDDIQSREVMSAFNPSGGYALLVQRVYNYGGDNLSLEGIPINGAEVVRYSGYSDATLNVTGRGGTVPLDLPGDGGSDRFFQDKHAFIVAWEPWVQTSGAAANEFIMNDLGAQTFILPISLPAGNVGDISQGFEEPQVGRGAFAQVTRLDDPTLTEWVRYDEVEPQAGQLVRSHRSALLSAYAAIANTGRFDVTEPPDEDESVGGGGGETDGMILAPEPPPATVSMVPTAPGRVAGAFWEPHRGDDEMLDFPLSRAVSNALQFRGVLETYSHAHPPGTPVLPVFSVADPGFFGADLGLDWGRPGMGDPVFVAAGDATELGFPMVIHRSHAPRLTGLEGVRPLSDWSQARPDELIAVDSGTTEWTRDPSFDAAGRVYFAFEEPAPLLLNGGQQVGDARLAARISKWPSGELPRIATNVGIGTGATGAASSTGANVPSAVIDEMRTAGVTFGRGGIAGSLGASMQLVQEVGEEDGALLTVLDGSLRTPVGLTEYMAVYNLGGPGSGLVQGSGGASPLDGLRPGGGLLRIGHEIVAYEGVSGTTVTLASGGRGLLGTDPQPHYPGEPITYLEMWRATTLSGVADESDEDLFVVDAAGFGSSGTVLIDGELIHFTRNNGAALGMPAMSEEPGAMDREGPGIFRGRFGTAASAHQPGTPVISFPFRYWDRWSDRADCPELAYQGFELDQPGAYWLSTFYEVENVAIGGSRIEVLVRTDPDAPWDAYPDLEPGLLLLKDGKRDGGPIPVSAASDMIEWRVFVRYDEGAFDPVLGTSHGWKTTPRLRHLGAEYLAPRRVLESVDR